MIKKILLIFTHSLVSHFSSLIISQRFIFSIALAESLTFSSLLLTVTVNFNNLKIIKIIIDLEFLYQNKQLGISKGYLKTKNKIPKNTKL